MGLLRPLTVLVDVDSVLADWEPAFVNEFRADFPHLKCAGVGERRVFDLNAGLTSEQKAATRTIMDKPGFYARLEPIAGASAAMNAMLAAGLDVAICTSPWLPNPTCASDKLDWMEQHIGEGWAARTLITHDKTRVMGDILIDDRPDITGAVATPTWEHIYFTQAYNANRTDRRRIDSWDEWEDVLFGEKIAA